MRGCTITFGGCPMPVQISQRGNRFALGQTESAYAIWPSTGGKPVQKWPKNDEGWAAAYREFQRLEGEIGDHYAPDVSLPASSPIVVVQGGSGLGTAALVLGIVGAAFGLIPLFAIIALICGAIAVVFGAIGLKRPGRGRAIAGLVLGLVALALGIWGAFIVD